MALRALKLWRAFDPARQLLRETGVLWMFGEDDSFGHESAVVLTHTALAWMSSSLAGGRQRDIGESASMASGRSSSSQTPAISSPGARARTSSTISLRKAVRIGRPRSSNQSSQKRRR